MKYLVTPEFTAKVAALSQDDRSRVIAIITKIEAAVDLESLSDSQSILGDAMHVFRNSAVRVFASTVETGAEKSLLLLDVVSEGAGGGGAYSASRDPMTNTRLNPNYNTKINPNYNVQLNPAYNPRINPAYNAQLNPAYNAQLNPAYNAQLNPAYNAKLNPAYNRSINPAYNRSINPSYNRTYGGPFLYNTSLSRVAYAVRVDDKVMILFDMKGKRIGQAARNPVDGYTTYDENNRWSGHLVPTGESDVYLQFDTQNRWLGLMI